jgi:hypothetical protein
MSPPARLRKARRMVRGDVSEQPSTLSLTSPQPASAFRITPIMGRGCALRETHFQVTHAKINLLIHRNGKLQRRLLRLRNSAAFSRRVPCKSLFLQRQYEKSNR